MTEHRSDCAVHNEPALPARECDCQSAYATLTSSRGGQWPAERRPGDRSGKPCGSMKELDTEQPLDAQPTSPREPKWVTDYERLLMSDDGPASAASITKELEQARARIKRLERALEPFAHYYIVNDCETANNDTIEVPVFDLWRAHIALTSALGKP